MKKYLRRGVGLIGTTVTLGSIPNISGHQTETDIKAKAFEGFRNIGNTFPAQGKIIGTRMVLSSLNKLRTKRRRK